MKEHRKDVSFILSENRAGILQIADCVNAVNYFSHATASRFTSEKPSITQRKSSDIDHDYLRVL